MPKFAKGYNPRKNDRICSKVNQVIYLSSPVSWQSFKSLAHNYIVVGMSHCPNLQIDRICSKLIRYPLSADQAWSPSDYLKYFSRYLADKILFWFLKGYNSRWDITRIRKKTGQLFVLKNKKIKKLVSHLNAHVVNRLLRKKKRKSISSFFNF